MWSSHIYTYFYTILFYPICLKIYITLFNFQTQKVLCICVENIKDTNSKYHISSSRKVFYLFNVVGGKKVVGDKHLDVAIISNTFL
jgi:hypothetical protein